MSFNPFGNPDATEAEQRRTMSATLEAVQLLQSQPGWLVVQAYIEGELQAVLAQMSNIAGQTGETALKASVAYSILSKIKDLPKELEKRLIQSLEPQKK